MTKQVEVITSVQCRRRWTAAEKERLVAASLQPGAVVSALALEAGVHPSQLYGWRRQLCVPAPGVVEDSIANSRTDHAGTFAAVRMKRNELSRKIQRQMKGRDFESLIAQLKGNESIAEESVQTGGRAATFYRLTGNG